MTKKSMEKRNLKSFIIASEENTRIWTPEMVEFLEERLSRNDNLSTKEKERLRKKRLSYLSPESGTSEMTDSLPGAWESVKIKRF